MKILVNGAEMVIPEAATIDHLLDLLEFKGRFAVEINGEIIRAQSVRAPSSGRR